jgi:hypothetical protein
MRIPGTTAIVLASGFVLAADVHTSIPDQFIGRWGGSLQSCADPGADDLRLDVEPGRMRFWESTGRVLAVATDGPLKLALLMEFSGEGETWLEALEFQLSQDRGKLSTVTSRRNVASRVRCTPAVT